MWCGAVCVIFLLQNHKSHCTMCGVVWCIVTCSEMRFCYFVSGFGAVFVVYAVW